MLHIRTFGGLSIEVDGAPTTGAAVQRKTLALLSLLAAAGKTGLSRDKLIAYLWPESDAEHGRSLLKQACYALRRDLHTPELFLGGTELRLNPDVVSSDVQTFKDALERRDAAQAIALYTGPFLDGFYLSESVEFERWVEAKRERLKQRAAEALKTLAGDAAARGNHNAAVNWWRWRAALEPLNSRVAVRLMSALAAAGDRGGALHYARIHDALLRDDLDAVPEAAVVELTARLREESAPSPPGAPASREAHADHEDDLTPRVAEAAPPSPPVSRAGATPPGPTRRRQLRSVTVAVALAVPLSIAGLALTLGLGRHQAAPIIAVGTIGYYGGADTGALAPLVAEMLTTNLARVPRFQVLSTARLYELLGPMRDSGREGTATMRAARAAHATELLQGILYQSPQGPLRLRLQQIDLQTGVVRRTYAVEGADAFAATDSATAAIAASFGVNADTMRIADVTTRSLAAYRLYVQGLRAWYREEDSPAALRLFEAALAEDSGFAMAAYYAGVLNPILFGPRSHLAQAVRLSAHVSERERLLIRGAWAGEAMDPSDLAVAETLATRYPAEPDGHYLLGIARLWRGDFLGAVAALRVVAAIDSLALRGVTPRCRGCEAMENIVAAYLMADSLPAAERAAREWLALQPRSGGAWGGLAVTLEHAGRFDEALAAYDSVLHLSSAASNNIQLRVPIAIRRGDFAEADALLRPNQQHATRAQQWQAWWWSSTSFRYQGRLREALAIAREMRAAEDDSVTSPPGPPYNATLIGGAVLLEMGRAREAAALFDSLAMFYGGDRLVRGRYARHLCWTLTHRATALAAAGDTAPLQRLADSLAVLGQQSSYGRDRQLHHYVRGLLALARGSAADALTELRQAVFSLTYGYTRTNLELARALLTLGRPREAAAVLEPALRGPLDASNLYVTHTELHEMLARAFDAAGERDSAVAHYRWVVAAWRNADPELQPRREMAVRRLRELQAHFAASGDAHPNP